MIALFSYFSESNFKVDTSARFCGRYKWENSTKCRKMVIFTGLHIRTLYFTPFLTKFAPPPPHSNLKKHQKVLKTCILFDKFKKSLSLFIRPPSILWLSFKIYNAPPTPLSKLH